MIAIPRLYQHYPSLPLSELSSLYSVGDNKFVTPATGSTPAQTSKICIISYLPKNLMISEKFSFTNKYVLFLENIQNVTSITWSYKLYNNGFKKESTTFIRAGRTDTNELDLNFFEGLIENDVQKFDKLKITCKVVKGGVTKELFLIHNFAKMVNVKGLISETASIPFAGNPDTYNVISNYLSEYYSAADLLKWNSQVIEIGTQESTTLLKIVMGIIYYNIQKSENMNSEFIPFFDFEEFSELGLKSFINDSVAYNATLKNGICQIPLHILSDIMGNIENVPDYAAIDTGSGNVIFNILRDNGLMTFNDLEYDVLRTVPQQVQDSRDRITGDIPRLIKLFHLSSFPKPAIRLAAILVKYLFRCSQENSCNECKNKDITWPFITLDGLKDHPGFLKNILTHYYWEPSNKIDLYTTEAVKTTSLVWSPYVYSLLFNIKPRILKAYFAKRNVTKTDTGEFWIEFDRLGSEMFTNAAGNLVNEEGGQLADSLSQPMPKPAWENYLGREFFLIIETLGCKKKSITSNIKPSSNIFSTQDTVQNLRIQMGAIYVTDIVAEVGKFDFLHTNANVLPGTAITEEYLTVNHSDKAIIKIRLRPDTRPEFDLWTSGNGLGLGLVTGLGENTVSMEIIVKRTDNAICFFGNDDSQTILQGEFLNTKDKYNNIVRYRIKNRIVYEIHHSDNPWNVHVLVGADRGRIGKIENEFIQNIANSNAVNLPLRMVAYYYYDENGNEHFISDCNLSKPRKRRNGRKVYTRSQLTTIVLPATTAPNYAAQLAASELQIDTFLANYPVNGNRFFYINPIVAPVLISPVMQPIATAANNLGESREKYYGSHDGVTSHDASNLDLYDQIVVRGVNKNAIVSFELDTTNPAQLRVEIVRMPDLLNIVFVVNGINKHIRYSFSGTERKYANPGCFAAFLGILAQLNYTDVVSTGMCFDDSTSYPSVTHPNGDSIDTGYLNTSGKRSAIIAAFQEWNFTQVISGTNATHNGDGADVHDPDHNNHLHSGNFDVLTVQNLIS